MESCPHLILFCWDAPLKEKRNPEFNSVLYTYELNARGGGGSRARVHWKIILFLTIKHSPFSLLEQYSQHSLLVEPQTQFAYAEDGIFLHQYSSSHSYPKLNVASSLVDESGDTQKSSEIFCFMFGSIWLFLVMVIQKDFVNIFFNVYIVVWKRLLTSGYDIQNGRQ